MIATEEKFTNWHKCCNWAQDINIQFSKQTKKV